MKSEEKLGIKDELEIKHLRQRKRSLVTSRSHDLIVNIGKTTAARLLYDSTKPHFGYIAIGQGTGIPAAANVTLENEITTGGGARKASTNSIVDTNILQMEATFDFTASFAVTESGVFNASGANAGDMLCRQTFSAVNVVSGDSLVLRWQITVG